MTVAGQHLQPPGLPDDIVPLAVMQQLLNGEKCMGWITRNVPAPIVNAVRVVLRMTKGEPQLGEVSFGSLRRVTPVSRHFGTDRGGAIDRHYIETFLQARSNDIRGRVLEIGEATYTRRFGGGRVTHSDVLHVHDRNPAATIVGDLMDLPQVSDETFDCIILTQTLQLVYRPAAAVATLHRILKPGGVLLATVPGITQVATSSEWGPTWYWSFTERSVQRLLGEEFGEDAVETAVHGNVLAATAHLYGLGAVELSAEELASTDPDYQVIITARAVKQGAHETAPSGDADSTGERAG
jgi:SAM-dependent methyltransferase